MSHFFTTFPILPLFRGKRRRSGIKCNRQMFFRPTFEVYGYSDEKALLTHYDENAKERLIRGYAKDKRLRRGVFRLFA